MWRHNAPEEPRPDNEMDTVDELHIDNELTTVNMRAPTSSRWKSLCVIANVLRQCRRGDW
ncbi:hypothetical protein PR003_g30907 [Phytophthora rubi]|uniref:Uncharacterized protein n=1 Tax=Phytophthora rubi TaxID=129364 RepID=A0A6A4BBN6_9STRA|nr:hypothetical protein PR003_g30907 [Phytophthora rubi]